MNDEVIEIKAIRLGILVMTTATLAPSRDVIDRLQVNLILLWFCHLYLAIEIVKGIVAFMYYSPTPSTSTLNSPSLAPQLGTYIQILPLHLVPFCGQIRSTFDKVVILFDMDTCDFLIMYCGREVDFQTEHLPRCNTEMKAYNPLFINFMCILCCVITYGVYKALI